MCAMTHGPQLLQGHFSRLIAHYSVVLPSLSNSSSASSLASSTSPVTASDVGFVESSLELLAAAGVHPSEDVHLPARLLLQGAIERLSAAKRARCAEEWCVRYLGLVPTGSKDGRASASSSAAGNVLHALGASLTQTLASSSSSPARFTRVPTDVAPSARPSQGEVRALLLLRYAPLLVCRHVHNIHIRFPFRKTAC